MRAADLHRMARTLREMALVATENTGADRVNAGELAVLEDVARHPGATIAEVTARTGLAQSLVSRITRAMSDAGALSITPDPGDRRKVRIDLDDRIRPDVQRRADSPITDAVRARTSALEPAEHDALEHHLGEVARLLALNTDREQRARAAGTAGTTTRR